MRDSSFDFNDYRAAKPENAEPVFLPAQTKYNHLLHP
jgi:hypothetical protein